MKLTLAEPKYLKESIMIISDLVDEAQFEIKKDGIELVAMDPANAAMVIFKLLASAFTEYELKDEVKIGINLSNLKQILRRAKPADMITLQVDDKKLKIQLKSNSTRTFSLPIIDMEEKEQRIPELKFPVKITMEAGILSEAVEDADIVSESVSLIADGDKFRVSAEGDLSRADIELKSGEETRVESSAKEKVRAKYSVEYLKKMMSGSKLADKVTLQFNKDYPLRLDYIAIDRVALSFILAPRVDEG
ncbi:TPA: proliferating cell nuclear antigen (pcna) [Candidatus Woesearchaeota archaeon]|nr:proliferating cell nuclear antigen (pcna) [Candidatus Woesearchaeota archaeon]